MGDHATKATLQYHGIGVHIVYEILPVNIVLWHLDPDKYQGVDSNLVILIELLLRQVHGNEIQLDAIENDFYQSLVNPSYPDYIPGEEKDIPF